MAIGGDWKKSTFSQADNCVEVRYSDHLIQVRNSKAPAAGCVTFTEDEWRVFLAGAADCEFDLPIDI